eukprot:GHRQ01021268.1.p1 GENE.GHRQ01021268.1~~GHRQ01021268.1.p1  ORF type:complete len:275 (+),score=57.25 GHRQ01021268.1:162-986(+)
MAEDMEYTLAMIKPDAVAAGKASEIQQLAEMQGFLIIAKRQLQLTTRLAEEFYVEHKDKTFFNGLVEFMTSGPIVALVLSKADAVRAWRELMGPTNVFDARLKAPKRCAADAVCNQAAMNCVIGIDMRTWAVRVCQVSCCAHHICSAACLKGNATAMLPSKHPANRSHAVLSACTAACSAAAVANLLCSKIRVAFCCCSLRALYGSDGTRNATHGSDSPKSAAREIKFYFPTLQLATATQDAAAAQVRCMICNLSLAASSILVQRACRWEPCSC